MLQGVVNPLNLVTLRSLGEVPKLLDTGKSRAIELGSIIGATDDVIHYALALRQYHEDFLEQVSTWRGPETNLKRAILALGSETRQHVTETIEDMEAPNA